jgi:hypothetical protein
MSQVKAQVQEVQAQVHQVLAAVHHLSAEVSRSLILNEEQNSRNRIVLEGLTGLAQRQDRLEVRMDDVEKTVRSIARAKG